ncbi:T9SS type A sorting domain-containing protein [Draconibacterium aestuarii]
MDNSVSVYPNPSNGKIYVNLESLSSASVRVFNEFGKQVYHDFDITDNIYQIDLKVSSGFYYVEIISDNYTQVFKMIIK